MGWLFLAGVQPFGLQPLPLKVFVSLSPFFGFPFFLSLCVVIEYKNLQNPYDFQRLVPPFFSALFDFC